MRIDAIQGASTVSEECTIDHLGGLLADPAARRILTETRQDAHSAESLSDASGVSKPTVYRRLDELRVCDLMIEETSLDPEAGHHYTEFRTDLDRIVIDLDEDGFGFELERHEPMTDRFTRLVEEM